MTSRTRSISSWAACCLTLAALVAGCGGKGEEGSSSGGGGGGGGGDGKVTGGPGVTDSTISLGMLTDLSGVFAPLGDPIVKTTRLYWDAQNADGGVCGRKIKLVVKDHGYDPQKAVVQYRDTVDEVAAMQQLLGSPITAALLPQLKQDSMTSILVAWPSSLLGQDFVLEVGSPYDIEMINGLSYLMEQDDLAKGDKLGMVYFEGEYGENGLLGAEAFAEENGIELIAQKVKPTDEDMTGQVSAFRRQDVAAIAMTTAPTQLASLAGIAATQDFNVPIYGQGPSFDPALLKTPAAEALKANVLIGAPTAPYDADDPGPSASAAAFDEKYPDEVKKGAAHFGWGAGILMKEVLEAACAAGDLSREGILKAARTLDGVDTGGITPGGPLDYSQVGEPPSRATYIGSVADVPGGIKLEAEVESEQAKSYQVPGGES